MLENIIQKATQPATQVASHPEGEADAGSDPGKGFLLFNRRPVISSAIAESLAEAETLTGVNQSEIRMRLIGQGIGVLNVQRSFNELADCAKDLASLGIPCGVVEKTAIMQTPLPPAARHIHLTPNALIFLDRRNEKIFEINDATDLLIILTDLSGKAARQIMTAMAYTGGPVDKQFDDILKKISMARPAAIFYPLNPSKPHKEYAAGVYVDSSLFSYIGLGDKMTHSKGGNFRIMINQALAMARTGITDEHFGIARLPGASPDWNRDASAVAQDLGRYAGYILAAVRQNLLPFVPEPELSEDAAAGDNEGPAGGKPSADAAKGLKPPPDMNYSRITAFFQTSLPELIVGLIVIVSPVSLFVAGAQSIARHQIFWKAVAGSGILLAGVLMFCYSLVLLYYRRMIENTPTSKVRSMSMGMVELSGKTRRCYDLLSSATKTPCVYYQCRYYRYQRTGDNSRWTLTRSVSSGKIPFYLEDDTGRVLINPKNALFQVPLTTQSFRGSYIPTLSLQLHDPNTKVVEELIPIGTRLYVLGSAHIEKHGRKFTQILADKLRRLKQDPEAMAQYDINGDGRIDVDEWEAARKDAERRVYAESLANGPEQSESVVIKKSGFGMLPFIIADTEKKVVRRLLFRTLVFLAGGLIIMGASVGFLVKLFQ